MEVRQLNRDLEQGDTAERFVKLCQKSTLTWKLRNVASLFSCWKCLRTRKPNSNRSSKHVNSLCLGRLWIKWL